jgi:hypothetical protein
MSSITINHLLNSRDGTIAFVEFTAKSHKKILSSKNFEQRFNIGMEKLESLFSKNNYEIVLGN